MSKQGLEAARGRLAARLLKLAALFGAKVEKALEKQRAKQGRGEPAETRAALTELGRAYCREAAWEVRMRENAEQLIDPSPRSWGRLADAIRARDAAKERFLVAERIANEKEDAR